MGIIHEHEIIKTKFEIQEQALKFLVHQIHDNIGQILSLAKLHLGTMDLTKPEEVAQKAFSSNQLIGKAIQDLRSLTSHLDAHHVTRAGLLRSIRYELEHISPERAADPLFTAAVITGTVSKEEELLLFRLVQDCIHYFLEDSATSQISVQVESSGETLKISIMNKSVQSHHVAIDADSLLNRLHSRTALLGARLELQSPADNEIALHILLPFSSR